MSLEELKLDAEEIAKFLGESERPRVKNCLMVEKHRVDTEIFTTPIKNESNANASASASIIGRLIKVPRSEDGPSSKRYKIALDQSDKFKMSVKLDGLTEDDVDVTFTDKSMVLHVKNGLKLSYEPYCFNNN